MVDYDAQAAVRLGAYIRELRQKQAITGTALGLLVNLSQSKISKIEHGQQPLVSNEMLNKILKVLKASASEKRQADLLAASANIPTDFIETFQWSYQVNQHLDLQEHSRHIWQFTANVIPAFLQTTDYRIAQLKRMGLEGQRLNDNMRENSKRQDMLWNIEQRYHIVCLESTLYTRPSTIQNQLAQFDRLERMLDLGNCKVGIIPLQSGSSFFPLPACTFYDKKIIIYEVGARDVATKNDADIASALKTFKQLEELSYTGDDAKILIRKAAQYFRSAAGTV